MNAAVSTAITACAFLYFLISRNQIVTQQLREEAPLAPPVGLSTLHPEIRIGRNATQPPWQLQTSGSALLSRLELALESS
jgi:hypothetical protein